jgi:hypothetical protein
MSAGLEIELALASRLDARRRLFPPGAACSCGVSNPLVLVLGRRPVVCMECEARGRGLSGLEEHHLGGRPSGASVWIGANLHELLSVLQDVTWRGRFAPGSLEADLIDLVNYLVAPALL